MNKIAAGGIWTHDLLVMSQASFQTALPRYNIGIFLRDTFL